MVIPLGGFGGGAFQAYAYDIPEKDKDYSYTDADITFYVNVYKNYEQADWCLSNLRQHFPDTRLLVVSDGDPDESYKAFEDKYGAVVKYQPRLFLYESKGMLLHQRILDFMEQPTKYLLKIDTDTGIHRRFKYLPKYEFFGNPHYYTDYHIRDVIGGFVGLSLEAATILLESKIFLDEKLPQLMWKKRGVTDDLLNEDQVFAQGCQLAEIEARPFPEVRITLAYLPNKRKTYAITHPNKNMTL